MSWKKVDSFKDLLTVYGILEKSHNCNQCGTKPGQAHESGCDIERCSICGGQYISCVCGDDKFLRNQHDPLFARWSGFYPGTLECIGLGMIVKMGEYTSADLNEFYRLKLHKQFFVKPGNKS